MKSETRRRIVDDMENQASCQAAEAGVCDTPMDVKSERDSFVEALENLINSYGEEIGSNTPDYLLAQYLIESKRNFDRTVRQRDAWHAKDVRDVENRLREVVMQALGSASVAWGESPKGVFRSDLCISIGEVLIGQITEIFQK